MSFSRFTPDCDVYTFLNVDGEYECCGCCIRGEGEHFSGPEWFDTREALANHVEEHARRGDKVPEGVIARILNPNKM